jgi:hypothetical protein
VTFFYILSLDFPGKLKDDPTSSVVYAQFVLATGSCNLLVSYKRRNHRFSTGKSEFTERKRHLNSSNPGQLTEFPAYTLVVSASFVIFSSDIYFLPVVVVIFETITTRLSPRLRNITCSVGKFVYAVNKGVVGM